MMVKFRAIPEGFMTVGEVAKKMGVIVRTLHTTIKKNCFPHQQKVREDVDFILIKI